MFKIKFLSIGLVISILLIGCGTAVYVGDAGSESVIMSKENIEDIANKKIAVLGTFFAENPYTFTGKIDFQKGFENLPNNYNSSLIKNYYSLYLRQSILSSGFDVIGSDSLLHAVKGDSNYAKNLIKKIVESSVDWRKIDFVESKVGKYTTIVFSNKNYDNDAIINLCNLLNVDVIIFGGFDVNGIRSNNLTGFVYDVSVIGSIVAFNKNGELVLNFATLNNPEISYSKPFSNAFNMPTGINYFVWKVNLPIIISDLGYSFCTAVKNYSDNDFINEDETTDTEFRTQYSPLIYTSYSKNNLRKLIIILSSTEYDPSEVKVYSLHNVENYMSTQIKYEKLNEVEPDIIEGGIVYKNKEKLKLLDKFLLKINGREYYVTT